MTGPVDPRTRLQIQGAAIDPSFKVHGFEKLSAKVDSVATFVFQVAFKAKEKPIEADEAFNKGVFSEQIHVHAESLEEALQILQVMGNRFKQMNRGDLQNFLKRDFTQIHTYRKFDEKEGTTMKLATPNQTTGEVKYSEVGLSSNELRDLHLYADYLTSDQALKDGVVTPEGQASLTKASPTSRVTLEQQPGYENRTTFNLQANPVLPGTNAVLSYDQEPTGVSANIDYQIVDNVGSFLSGIYSDSIKRDALFAVLSEEAKEVALSGEEAEEEKKAEVLFDAIYGDICRAQEKISSIENAEIALQALSNAFRTFLENPDTRSFDQLCSELAKYKSSST